MLIEAKLIGTGLKVAVVVGRFNEFITSKLLQGSMDGLKRHGVDENDIDTVWVPGAYEIPLIAKKLAATGKYDAIIALGTVIRGSTTHYDYVCNEAAKGISNVSLTHEIPVMFGILTTENIEQAISAYQQSLTVFTLEQFPKEWAFTQSLLGIAYYHRLQPDRFQENLKLAIAAFRQALTVLNFQNYPAEWLATQNNLGIVYLNYLDGDRTTNLELAREAFESIEKVLVEDLEKYPNNSAELLLTRYHLAIVYRELEQVKPTENLKRSLQAIDVILSSLKLELPTDWLQ